MLFSFVAVDAAFYLNCIYVAAILVLVVLAVVAISAVCLFVCLYSFPLLFAIHVPFSFSIPRSVNVGLGFPRAPICVFLTCRTPLPHAVRVAKSLLVSFVMSIHFLFPFFFCAVPVVYFLMLSRGGGDKCLVRSFVEANVVASASKLVFAKAYSFAFLFPRR